MGDGLFYGQNLNIIIFNGVNLSYHDKYVNTPIKKFKCYDTYNLYISLNVTTLNYDHKITAIKSWVY